MAVKAIAKISYILWNGVNDFRFGVEYIGMSEEETGGTLNLTMSPTVSQVTFESNIRAAVRTALQLGMFDEVRIIGATI